MEDFEVKEEEGTENAVEIEACASSSGEPQKEGRANSVAEGSSDSRQSDGVLIFDDYMIDDKAANMRPKGWREKLVANASEEMVADPNFDIICDRWFSAKRIAVENNISQYGVASRMSRMGISAKMRIGRVGLYSEKAIKRLGLAVPEKSDWSCGLSKYDFLFWYKKIYNEAKDFSLVISAMNKKEK